MRPVLSYLIFGVIWMVVSDQLLSRTIQDPVTLERLQNLKGLLFVAISGVLLYVLIRLDLQRREKAAREMQRSQDRFARYFLNSPAPSCITTFDEGRFIDANDSFLRLFGYSREEVIGRTTIELRLWTGAGRRRQVIDRLKREGSLRDIEIEFADAQSQVHHGLISMESMEVEDQACICTFIQDITRIKHTENRLRESEARFRRFVDSNIIGVAIVELSGRILEANDILLHTVGYKRHDFETGIIDWSGLVAEESLPAITRAWEQLKESALALPVEIECVRRDGSRIPILMGCTLEEGSADTAIMFVLDLTESKRTEEALRESEQRYRTLIDTAHEGIMLLDEANRVTYVNRQMCDMLGYETHEMVRHSLLEFMDHATRNGAEEHINRRRQGLVDQFDYLFRRKDGTELWAIVAANSFSNKHGVSAGTLAMVTDITERKHSEAEIQHLNTEMERRLRRITALHEIDLGISASVDVGLTLQLFLEQAIVQLGVDAAAVLQFSPGANSLQFLVGRGFLTGALRNTVVRLGQGHAGRVALERTIVHVADLSHERAGFESTPLLSEEGFVSYYGIPLIARGRLQGVLEIFHRSPLQVDEEWMDFLKTLATQAAIAIDSTTLFNDLQRSNLELILAYDTTLEGWSRALDLRDKETEGHTQRVTHETVRLAQVMVLPPAELVHIRRGALLHDMGKMGIPDHILLKPGPLTEEEWVIMKMHPVYAFELLTPISFLRPALHIPLSHHEKWDGSGYPYGINGEQIPLAARIFAVVDVWDALTSDRPYRKAWTQEKTLDYIKAQSGSHFDPKVVDAFLTLHPLKPSKAVWTEVPVSLKPAVLPAK